MLRRRPLLVIEDSDDDFTILETCLRSVGVTNQLVRCANAAEIDAYLEEAKGMTTIHRPAFVFLDLNLPGIHGTEVLKRFKAHSTMSMVPTVVLTTSSQPKDVETAYSLGAAGYITKPVDLDKFERMVQQVAEYWFSCVRLPENMTAP